MWILKRFEAVVDVDTSDRFDTSIHGATVATKYIEWIYRCIVAASTRPIAFQLIYNEPRQLQHRAFENDSLCSESCFWVNRSVFIHFTILGTDSMYIIQKSYYLFTPTKRSHTYFGEEEFYLRFFRPVFRFSLRVFFGILKITKT